MRILHVAPYFFPAHIYGGPIQSVYRLCESTVRHGLEVHVLTTDANGPTARLSLGKDRTTTLGHGVHVRYCRRLGAHSASAELLHALPMAVATADLVHLTAVYSFTSIPTLLMCRALGRPVVWSPRGALQRWAGSTRRHAKRMWEIACGLVAPTRLCLHATSQAEADSNSARFPRRLSVVIPNGVDVPPRLPARNPDREALRLLFLGRIHPIKGIDRLLAACDLLLERWDANWRLTIAGDGDPRYVMSLKSRVLENRRLAQRVKFVGAVTGPRKEQLLSNSDVLVLPSHVENFGIVVAEALALGLPVIASRGSPWERVEEIGCGLWVDNNPHSLASSIERVAELPRVEMGKLGYEWMSREFSWSSVAARMVSTYRELLHCAR